MVVTEVITPVELIAYQCVLARVAEEFVGARTAYYYDLLLRFELAKDLEAGTGNVQDKLCKLDRDVLGDAKLKVEKQTKAPGQPSGPNANSSNPGSKGGKGGGKPGGGKHAGDSSMCWSNNQGASHSQRSRSPYQSGKPDRKRGDKKTHMGGAGGKWGRGGSW